jgi:hypothetical protein
MANTTVSICSNALGKLGDDSITSLSDNSNRARWCNRKFDTTRQALLRKGNWNDSIKRVALAQIDATPAWEYTYIFALPSDFMKMVKTSIDQYDEAYKLETYNGQRVLVTDESSIYITYVFDNSDVASYDSLHVDALEALLAFELANAITGKQNYRESMWGEYLEKMKEAKVADGQDDYQEEQTSSILTDIRY